MIVVMVREPVIVVMVREPVIVVMVREPVIVVMVRASIYHFQHWEVGVVLRKSEG